MYRRYISLRFLYCPDFFDPPLEQGLYSVIIPVVLLSLATLHYYNFIEAALRLTRVFWFISPAHFPLQLCWVNEARTYLHATLIIQIYRPLSLDYFHHLSDPAAREKALVNKSFFQHTLRGFSGLFPFHEPRNSSKTNCSVVNTGKHCNFNVRF